MTFRKEIGEAVMIPKYYGISWHSYERNVAVCYPIPLNSIFRLGYLLLGFLKFPLRNYEYFKITELQNENKRLKKELKEMEHPLWE